MSEYIRVLNRLQGVSPAPLPARRAEMPERARDAVPPPRTARPPAAAPDTTVDMPREGAAAGCPSRSAAVTARLDALLHRVGTAAAPQDGLRWLVCLGAGGDEPIAAVVDELLAHADRLGLRARRAPLASLAAAAPTAATAPALTILEASGACSRELARLPHGETAVMIVAEAGRTRREALDAMARRMSELGWAEVGVVVYAPTPYWPGWARWLFARLTARRGARMA
jgi:hypothetical protein